MSPCKMERILSIAVLGVGLLLVAVAAIEDENGATSSSRNQFYDGSTNRETPNQKAPATSSRRPTNYFHAFRKQQEGTESRQSNNLNLGPYRQQTPYKEPVQVAPPSYRPVYGAEKSRPNYSAAPAAKPVAVYHKNEPKYSQYQDDVKIEYDVTYSEYCPKLGGLESECRPTTECAVWYDLVLQYLPETACKLPSGDPGSCCPEIPYNGQLKKITSIHINWFNYIFDYLILRSRRII